MPIAKYLAEVNKRFRTGISREHSYRGDLQTLIESLVTGIIATNEPARINCGAPDYVITKNNIPLGYIEAKDLDDDRASPNDKGIACCLIQVSARNRKKKMRNSLPLNLFFCKSLSVQSISFDEP